MVAIIRSGMIVLIANIVEVLTVLVRNIILARLLPVEEFGLAATFAILMTMVETLQNVGLNRLVVQHPDVDDARLLAGLHGAQILVSAAASGLLMLFAWPFSLAMGTAGLAPAYLALSLVPMVNAFTHLDVFRVQRHGRFGPQALRALLSQPIGLLAVFPGYWWFGDHRAALVAIIAQQAAAAALTHIAVTTPYRIRFDAAIWRTVAAFGWPLVASGLLMFLILNGDRMIVLNQFGAAALGWFSAATMLTLTPANLVAKSLQTVALPPLVRAGTDGRRFQALYDACVGATAWIAMAMVGGTWLLGAPILIFLFGPRYLPASTFLVALACMNAMRLFRAVPATAAMARGDPRNSLYTNLVRVIGVPLAFVAALLTEQIAMMIAVGIIAEVASAALAGVLADRRCGAARRPFGTILTWLSACFAAILIGTWYNSHALVALLPFTVLLGAQSLRTLPMPWNPAPSLRRPAVSRTGER